MKRHFIFAAMLSVVVVALPAPRSSTNYSVTDCQGSARPYPEPSLMVQWPDSLTPVMINHVGRHGARFPASESRPASLLKTLTKAQSQGSLTKTGRQLKSLVENVIAECSGRWGALDSLGMAEQRGIARRMVRTFPMLFKGQQLTALSSYIPRCVMSMYSFTHEVASLSTHTEIFTSAGRQTTPLMRPFSIDKDYLAFRSNDGWKTDYDPYFLSVAPIEPARRVLGSSFKMTDDEARDFSMTMYGFLSGMSAMGMNVDLNRYFSDKELNALWSCNNLKQYLQRTASAESSVPAKIASNLLLNLITTADEALASDAAPRVQLRFGHAETLMPLLSLMKLSGCYYDGADIDAVQEHWHNFDVVPMAANLQLVFFRSVTGRHYVMAMHNEVPVPIIPGCNDLFVPWSVARAFWCGCISI